MTLKHVVEALIFASQKPLMPREVVQAIRGAAEGKDDEAVRAFSRTKEAEVCAALEELKIEYLQAERAFQLVERVNGWHLVTQPEFGPWVRQLYPESKPVRLSGPALETLAIIAYRQPIMKADIEAVRGVAVDGLMQSLLERNLIRIGGRADVPGRPLLYETTEYFLEHFGLKTVDELPNADELRRVHLPSAPVAATAPSADQQMSFVDAPAAAEAEPEKSEAAEPPHDPQRDS